MAFFLNNGNKRKKGEKKDHNSYASAELINQKHIFPPPWLDANCLLYLMNNKGIYT